MTRPKLHRPARVWILGMLIGVIAGAATIYLLGHPPLGAPIVATIAP